jgi:general secretion pathway protein D
MTSKLFRSNCSTLIAAVLLLGIGACAVKPAAAPAAKTQPPASTAPRAPDANGNANTANDVRAPVIVLGSGALVAQPQPSEPAAAAAPGNGFQLNFVDTDISQVVGAVLGDGLGRPYVIDPQVKGTMTLQAARPLSRDEVLSALEAALRNQGAALIDVGGIYHVAPAKDAARHITNLQVPGQVTHGYGTYVVPLQYVSAVEMEKVLQPFAPEGGIIKVDESRNLLLLAGTGQEISTLLNVVKTFDVDWLAGMSFALYPLEYVDAKTLAGELTDVFAGGKSPLAGVVRFVPLARLNALMVVTPQPKYLQDVAAWIKRLDLGSTTPGRRIYVYDAQNAKADDLANSLAHILGLRGDSSQGGGLPSSATGGGVAGGARPAGTYGSTPAGSLPPGSLLGGPLGGQGGYSGSPSPSGSALDQGSLQIVPNEDNNSLLILASPSEYAVIESAVKRLDVVPIQILIEASIAEVTLTDETKYGLQWAYNGKNGPVTFSEAPNGAILQAFPGFSYLYTGSVNITAVLNALETMSKVKVLSSPKLMVLNNHEATLEVGDQVPVATQSAVSVVTPGSPVVNSIQLQQTGVILHVTPRANKSGRVILDVSQEVSTPGPTTSSSLNSPTIQQRRVSSTVAVSDGETVALGGIIQESRTNTGDGIPFLRRIPVIGALFGTTDKQSTRSELIVLLTPHVIRSDAESAAVMNDLQDEFRGLRRAMPGVMPEPSKPAAAKPDTKPPTANHSPEPQSPSIPAGSP